MWRGRAFASEELAGFDLEAMIGANCHLVVIHNHKDDRTYANVKGIMPLGGTATKVDIPADYVRIQDRPQPNGGPQNHHGRPWEAEDEEDDPDDGLPLLTPRNVCVSPACDNSLPATAAGHVKPRAAAGLTHSPRSHPAFPAPKPPRGVGRPSDPEARRPPHHVRFAGQHPPQSDR